VTWPLFTKQTIFIVVVDVGRDHAFSRLAHWIRLIDMRAPGASVSIAALYSGEDLLSGYEETMKKLLLKIRERTSILVKGFAFVHSVKHQKGIETMREILKKISVEFLCDQSIPGSFVELERLLQAEAFDRDKDKDKDKEKDKDRERDRSQTSGTPTGSKILFSQGQAGLSRSFIHWDEVVAKGKSLSNTPDELWLSRAISTLNSLGYLIYPREFKSEIVILNLQVRLTLTLHSSFLLPFVLTFPLQHYLDVAMKTVEEALKRNGEMTETRLTEFWTSLGISPHIIPGLLVHFSYYDLVAKPRIPHDPPTYFVTTALPKEASSTFEGWDKLLSTQSSRRYELNSLPPDIFPRLIFRLLTNCRVVKFWKNGAYILDANNEETCALLKRKKRLIGKSLSFIFSFSFLPSLIFLFLSSSSF
jgi:hypothetical protein